MAKGMWRPWGYLKVWEGVTVSEGVGMGDCGGYPELKHALFQNIMDLARHPTKPGERIYEVRRVEVADRLRAARRVQHQQALKAQLADLKRRREGLLAEEHLAEEHLARQQLRYKGVTDAGVDDAPRGT